MGTIQRLYVAAEANRQSEITGGCFVTMPFYRDGRPVTDKNAPRWGMSLRSAGSMRFRWNEINENRLCFLKHLCLNSGTEAVSLELVHSKDVLAVTKTSDTVQRQADGMITLQRKFVPVVTVADCMPIFLYDSVTGMFGALHSGWKGTGIVVSALEKAYRMYGTRPEDVCVVLGPHIHSCCYIVDESRAEYFSRMFAADCVMQVTEQELAAGCRVPDWNSPGKKLYRLSLERANLVLLAKAGVRSSNIAAASDCTCCTDLFGSFRRETSVPCKTGESNSFTVQCAFCGFF